MPKVKNPLLSMEARGGIGGLVYNTWRGINTVKTNTSPTGQGTVKRLAAQARLAAISAAWRGLAQADRDGWEQYAQDHPVTDWTGSPKRLTGMNWYVSCNANLNLITGAPITAAPVVAPPDALVGLSLSQVAAALAASWTTPVGTTFTIVWFIVGPLSPGITPKIQRAHFHRADPAQSTQPFEIVATPAVGRWTLFGKVIAEATGLASTWQSDYLDIT